MDKWQQALKEYAVQTGKFVVPKKGSDDYLKVKAIYDRNTPTATTAITKTRGRTKSVKVAVDIVGSGLVLAGETPAPRKPRAKRGEAPPVM